MRVVMRLIVCRVAMTFHPFDNSQGAPGPNGDPAATAARARSTPSRLPAAPARFLLLPATGHKGNSHMLMMEKHNLADLIIGWPRESAATR